MSIAGSNNNIFLCTYKEFPIKVISVLSPALHCVSVGCRFILFLVVRTAGAQVDLPCLGVLVFCRVK